MARFMTIGGSKSFRRLFLTAAVALCALSPAASLAAAEEPDPEVAVREEKGVFTVSAEFEVPQTPACALAVLTDYERIPSFMPGVTTSVIRERSAGRTIVEQEALARMMFFSKRIHLLLEVREDEDTLTFKDSARRSFTRYEGTWRLSRRDGQTVIRYELRAQPNFEVPGFLLRRLLKRDARQMIDALRVELAARQGHVIPDRKLTVMAKQPFSWWMTS
jgi:ribosome-associated toxin RatA of RatAB toxin-antitoxin module